MNARFRLPIVALCIAGMLAGCGSVTQGISFQPPAGWTGTPAMFGRFQMWMKAGQQKDSPQLLMLIRADAKNVHSDLGNLPPQYSNNLKVIRRGRTNLCGGAQPAEQFIAEGSDKNGKRSHIEIESTIIGSARYIAMYIRPMSMQPDAQAETAIHALCPTK